MKRTDKIVSVYVRTFKQAKRMARALRAIHAPSFAREAEYFAAHSLARARLAKEQGNA